MYWLGLNLVIDKTETGMTPSGDVLQLVDEQKRIAEIGRLVASTLDVASIYPGVAQLARSLVAADRMVITVFAEDESELIDLHIDGVSVEGSYPGFRHPAVKDSTYEQIFVYKIPLVAKDKALDEYGGDNDLERDRKNIGLKALLLVPLIWQERSYGILSFRAFDPDAFTDHRVELAQQVANQIAGAFATSYQYAELEAKAHEREQLAEIRQIIGSSLDIEEIFGDFAAKVRELVPAERIILATVDQNTQVIDQFIDGLHVEGPSTAMASPALQQGVLDRHSGNTAIFVKNGEDFERYSADIPDETLRFKAGLRAILAIPLAWRGELVGSLTLRSTNPKAYNAPEIELAEQIADQIASAIHAANQYQLLHEEARQRKLLAEVGRVASSALDVGSIFTPLADVARELITFDRFSVLEIEDSTLEVYNWHVTGQVVSEEFEPGPFQITESAVPKSVYVDQNVFVTNVDQILDSKVDDPHNINQMMADSDLVSVMFVPVVLQGTTVGVLIFRATERDRYGEIEVNLARQIAALISGLIGSVQQRKLIQAESAERRRLAEDHSALVRMGRSVNSSLQLEQVFEQFVSEAKKLVPFERIVVLTLGEDGSEFRYVLVEGEGGPALESQLVDGSPLEKRAVFGQQQIVLNGDDYRNEAQSIPGEITRFNSGLRSLLITPLVWQGESIGGITLRSVNDDAYGERETALVTHMAALLSGAITAANQLELLEREATDRRKVAEERARIAEIGRIVSSTLELEEVFTRFVDEARTLVPFDRLVISLNDPDGINATDVFVSGNADDENVAGKSYPIAGGVKEPIFHHNEVLLANENEFREIAELYTWERERYEFGYRSLMVVPLIWQSEVIGTLIFRSFQPNPYGAHESELASQISAQIAGAVYGSTQYRLLQESEKSYRDLVESNKILVWRIDS